MWVVLKWNSEKSEWDLHSVHQWYVPARLCLRSCQGAGIAAKIEQVSSVFADNGGTFSLH